MSETHYTTSETLGWRIGETRQLADYGPFRVQKLTATSPRNDETFEFSVIDRPDCVLLIPFTKDGRVILVEQFRPGIRKRSIEFPAGVMDKGESPLETARRELEEETGFRAARMQIVGDGFQDPAILNTCITFVAAYDCEPTGEKRQDAKEDVHTRLCAAGEVSEMISNGEIKHTVIVAGWYLALSFHQNG